MPVGFATAAFAWVSGILGLGVTADQALNEGKITSAMGDVIKGKKGVRDELTAETSKIALTALHKTAAGIDQATTYTKEKLGDDAATLKEYVKSGDLVDDIGDTIDGGVKTVQNLKDGYDQTGNVQGAIAAAFPLTNDDSTSTTFQKSAQSEMDLAYFKENYNDIMIWLASEAYSIWPPLGEIVIGFFVDNAQEATQLASIFERAAKPNENDSPDLTHAIAKTAGVPDWVLEFG